MCKYCVKYCEKRIFYRYYAKIVWGLFEYCTKNCINIMQILYNYCKILYKYCANIVQNVVSILFDYCETIIKKKLGYYYEITVQILCQYCTNISQIL